MMQKGMIWVVGAVSALLGGCSGSVPAGLGVVDGNLRPCPDSPNCVCSTDIGRKSYIRPYSYRTEWAAAGKKLREIIAEQPGATILADQETYLHVAFRSKLLGFVDDVEFYLPQDVQQVEIRSASRLGWWDMGVNRKRMERFRRLFSAQHAE